MSVVTISETAGSLGNEIGRKLADTLGYAFADREIIAKAAERFGEDVSDLKHATEEKPTLWERFSDTQHRYKAYLEATMFEMAAPDNIVLAGLSSTLVLAPIPHILRIRTSAPEGVRALRLEQRQGLTHDAALDEVRQTDRERAARVRFLYHVDVDDPLIYDLVLNTERLSVGRGVRVIEETLRDERFQTTAASRAQFVDLSIMAQARAVLLVHPVLSTRQVSIVCKDAKVSLSGTVRSEEERTLAQEAIAQIPGCAEVQNEIIVLDLRRNMAARM